MSELSIYDGSAPLPIAYERAQAALAECSKIDECQAWADKAQALASYARQAGDKTLVNLAIRIQARAIRRSGELLRHIEAGKTGPKTQLTEGDHSQLSKTDIARQAGMSHHQQYQAIRVGNIPEDQFNDLVESDNPPTITALSKIGTKPLVNLGDISPSDYAKATKARGTLQRFAEFCRNNDPVNIAHSLKPHESPEMQNCVETVDAWMDRFVTNLPR